MRKLVPLRLAVVALICLAVSASALHAADADGRWGIGVRPGLYKLVLTDHTDAWTVGWLVNGDLKYGLSDRLALGVEGSLMRTYLADVSDHVNDGAGFTFKKAPDGPQQRAYLAGLFAQYDLLEDHKWSPYLAAGTGLYFWKYTDKDGNTLMSNDPAWSVLPKSAHVPPADLNGDPYELKDQQLYVMGGTGVEFFPSEALSFDLGVKFRYLTHVFTSFKDEKDIVGTGATQFDLPKGIVEAALGLTFHFGAGGCPPASASAAATPANGAVPLDVQFQGSVTGGCPDYRYNWDFGDGATSTEQNPKHTYDKEGTYTASLTVTDMKGKTAVGSAPVTATCPPVTATASGNPASGVAPLVVAFTGHAEGGCGPVTYVWEFGDGGTSADQSPSHEYAAEGNFTATLTVKDGKGATSSARVPVNVSSAFVPPPDSPVVLEGVNFKTNKAVLLPESSATLDRVAKALIDHPDVKIEIGGHTDADGSAAYNLKLSQQRANAVRDYLVKKGVPAERMTAKGYGETTPIADNKTPEGKAKNRRVELKRM